MGRAILKAASNIQEFKPVNFFENPKSDHIGKDAGENAGISKIGILIENSPKPGDYNVILDFTAPKASVEIAKFSSSNNKALVIGTTGFTDEQIKTIKECSMNIPIVLSPNMSVGVNLLYYLVSETARILGNEYDCEIIDIHHNRKKDSPSGTANKIAETIKKYSVLDSPFLHGRKGFYPERQRGEIGIHSLRAGDVIGEHRIMFAGSDEVLELTHKAVSRDTFALGALKAAKFVTLVEPGLYSMADVLKLPKTD